MAYKLFVGGLPFSTTQEELEQAFGEYGELESVTIITDRDSGRSKGFGFVEFVNEDDGKKAVEAFNGKEFGGRTVTVNEARPKEDRGDRRSGGGGGGDGGSFRDRGPRRSW